MRRLLALLLIVLSAAAPVAAQDGELETVLARIEAERSRGGGNLDEALAFLEPKAKAATPAQQRRIDLLVAYRDVLRGRYEAALGRAQAVAETADAVETRFRAHLLIANTSAITRDFVRGLRELDAALALQNEVKDPVVREMAYSVAAPLYNQYGQYALALSYAERVLASTSSDRHRCFATQHRAESLFFLGRPLREREDLAEPIAHCTAHGEHILANLLRLTWARKLAAEDRVDAAIEQLESHLASIEATRYARLIGEAHGLLAEFRLRQGDGARAQFHARRALATVASDVDATPRVMAHDVLYRVALARKDYRAALEHFRQYAEADKARLDDVKARELAFQLASLELKEKTQSIQLLSRQNEVLRLQQDLAEKNAWNFRLGAALLVLVAGMAVVWAWRARRTHRSLRMLAETDGLTGLSNRRHFRARAETLLTQAAIRGQPVSVLLFDLDHFKQVNDECGHAAGDWVLREVARVARGHCRQIDLVGRIGGEEFAMVLPGCDLGAAVRVAEQCRQAISAIDSRTEACGLPISASFGCASTARSGYEYEALVANADAAMYRSKVGGRNRVSLYESPEDAPHPRRPAPRPVADAVS